jgi:hypothetical protein
MEAIKVQGTREINSVQCTEAKLVFWDEDSVENRIDVDIPITQYGVPILISETEEILKDELMYDEEPERGLDFIRKQPDCKSYLGGGYYKILALPEHFTKEQLQDIVYGKLKEGDKVMVECSKMWQLYGSVCIDDITDKGITQTQYETGNTWKQIKQPLTLHKTEEGWDDIENIFRASRHKPYTISSREKKLFSWLRERYHKPEPKGK